MLLAVYIAWAILLIRGAKDPLAAASLFDWGILAQYAPRHADDRSDVHLSQRTRASLDRHTGAFCHSRGLLVLASTEGDCELIEELKRLAHTDT